MDTTTMSAEAGSPKAREQRRLGTEKFVVRVFREKMVDAVIRAGLAQEVLDDFLRTVLSSGDADPTDRKYARTTYQDAIVRIGGTGLPPWAAENGSTSVEAKQSPAEAPLPVVQASRVSPGTTTPLVFPANTPNPGPRNVAAPVAAVSTDPTEDEINEDLLALVSEYEAAEGRGTSDVRTAPVAPTSGSASALMAEADFFNQLEAMEEASNEPNPISATNGPLWSIMRAGYQDQMTNPFLESFTHGGVRYLAVGSVFGQIPVGKSTGKLININFTVNPYRSIRQIPSDILLRDSAQRVVMVLHESVEHPGLRKCLYVLKHKPGMRIRFWTRIDNKDTDVGRKFVVTTNDTRGWMEVDRKHF